MSRFMSRFMIRLLLVGVNTLMIGVNTLCVAGAASLHALAAGQTV